MDSDITRQDGTQRNKAPRDGIQPDGTARYGTKQDGMPRNGTGGQLSPAANAAAPWKILNREVIKYIAIVAMTFNHIANAGLIPYGTPRFWLFVDIGYITAITMSFFLVEGYHYTRSKRKYLLRLFVFALLSQYPYYQAFQHEGLNMIFTLWLCFVILLVMEYVKPLLPRILLAAGLILLSDIGDWGVFIPLATVLFAISRGNPARQLLSYSIVALLRWWDMYTTYIPYYSFSWTAVHGLLAVLPFFVSALLTLGLYNGRQAKRFRPFHRWFFYVYYPAHLLILCLIRRQLYGW